MQNAEKRLAQFSPDRRGVSTTMPSDDVSTTIRRKGTNNYVSSICM